jgi:DNA gyrase subunit B
MLSSAEVGTLITALGCGIGREEFNPDKLRYHRIIIMTDADVDGAHIRTLLLTFFYRQMPELIDRGYIYIAQPPLYKVKKGKQEQYLKDDQDLNNYFLQSALDNAALFVNADAPALVGESLENISRTFLAVMASIGRLSVRYDGPLLEKLITMSKLDEAMIENPSSLQLWIDELEGRLNTDLGVSESCTLSIVSENEAEEAGILLTRKIHGIGNERLIPFDFFNSVEYRKITELGSQLSDLLGEDAYVKREKRSSR